MATWTTRPAVRGTETIWGPGSPLESPSSSLASPSSPLGAAAPSSTPSTPPMSPSWVANPSHPPAHMTGGDSDDDFDDDLDDSGYDDWLDSQLAGTGEMTVVERLRYLLDTGQFADVNIRVGQGQNVTVFKAHRLLLATASQPLYRLVYQVCPNPGPNEVTTIRVTDMNPKDFEHILKYIYTDHIDCKKISVAFELLRASRKWGLAGLGIKSLTYLEEFVDNFEPKTDDVNTNLFELLVLSEETLNEMSEKCWQILVKHATEVIPCEGYLNLSQVMAKKVICHKDIKFENQLKLFEAIRDWGLRYIQNHNLKLTHLGNVVEELIKVIDFDRISDADFINTVLTSECLGKAEVIAFFMTHGLEIPRNLDFNNNKQICSLTQNGSVLEFNKVCRFRKGYRCPQKEIYQEQELRFRVDKNIKLLGVGFGFLFSCTDMGISVHCQGPWETRQWTDIAQSYCRVSGEKQETADVRLMFFHPVRIEANQSYKVMVKTVRMSQGSSEVELWGGTGGLYCVETEDAAFHFIKAAVDPNTSVEESDGDTKPGIITELLYQMDTGENTTPTTGAPRRRRPPSEVEEVEESSSPRRRRPEPPEEQKPVQSSPMRRRTGAEASLKVPEIPYVRKRSPPADDQKTPEAPPLCRRRESTETSSRKTSAEEYKPESFSTNRWRTRTRETETEYKKSPVEEYKPSSFSTNRWISRPKEDKTGTEKTTSDTSSYTSQKKTTEEYKPESFTSNRWRTRSKEEGTDTKKTLDVSRKASTEETKPETDRWRSKPQEEKKDTPFGVRRYSKSDESTVTHPFMRRRESKDTNAEIPFYLRPRPSQSEETKTTTGSAYSRSRWGSSATNSIAAKEDKPSTDTTSRSRFLRSSDSISSPSLRSTGSSTLFSRYGSARDTPLSRTRDTSLSRYGGSSGSSYLSSRYEPATSAGGTDTNSSDSSVSKYTTTPSTGAQSTSSSSYSRRYSSSSAPPGGYSSRYDSSASSGSGLSGVTSRYTIPAAAKEPVRYTSSVPIREPVRYGTSTLGSSSKLAALSAKYGSSAGSTSTSSGISRYGTSTSGSGSNLAALSAKYSPSAGSSNTSSGVSSRYGTSGSSDTSNGSSARYGSLSSSTSGPNRYGSTTSTSGSGSVLGSTKYDSSSATGRYGSPAPTSSRYGSPAPTSGSSSSYSSKYGLSAPAGGSSTLGGSSRYGSPGPTTSKYSSPAPTTSRYSSPAPTTSRYSSPTPTSSTGLITRYGSSGPGSDSGAKYGSGSTLSSLRTSTSGKDCDLCPTSRTNRYGSSTTSTRASSPVTAGKYSSAENSRSKWDSDGGRGKGDGESDGGDSGSS
ncbi:mucin-5AC-like isoform X2 [Homarus americanus]|uniref:mucin-5AC-like isoform X2 n=1 Tax=Homarus americanus TaxID=6706 RepID=UPI001C47126F|nr:mucin-5AC-like isoform X2 [Homarus americanus]